MAVIANNDSRTRISLLDSLRRGETDQAWLIFIEKYSKLISGWCHRWGASVEDTEDIVQETLLVVFRKIAEFQYDPSLSFRAWLKTVSYHKWLQAVEHNRLVYPPVQESSMVMTYKSRLNLAVEEFRQLLDRIAEQEIFNLACTKVRSRLSERVWLCFEQSELLNHPRSEIAERLGISTGYVQVNVFRVRQLVHAEIKALDHG